TGLGLRHAELLRISLRTGIVGGIGVPTVVAAAGTHQVQVQVVAGAGPRYTHFECPGSLRYRNQFAPPLFDRELTGELAVRRDCGSGRGEAPPAIAQRRSIARN